MSYVELDESKRRPLVICGFALLFAIPFHILLIIVLIRYRKADAFSFPFFRMILSLSISDLLTSIVNGNCFIMLLLPPITLVQYTTRLFHILQDAFLAGGLGGDCVILVAIGINRLLAYVFPMKSLWHPVHTKLAIALQWTYAVSIGLTGIPNDMTETYHLNETTGELIERIPETIGYQIKTVTLLVTFFTAGLTLSVVYSVCIGKLIYYKLSATGTGQGSQSLSVEARLSFQGFFLSSFLVIVTFMFGYASLMSFSVSPVFYGLIFIFTVSNFVCGPFIVIGMSSVIRSHIKKLFTFNNNQVVHVPAPKVITVKRHEEDKL